MKENWMIRRNILEKKKGKTVHFCTNQPFLRGNFKSKSSHKWIETASLMSSFGKRCISQTLYTFWHSWQPLFEIGSESTEHRNSICPRIYWPLSQFCRVEQWRDLPTSIILCILQLCQPWFQSSAALKMIIYTF